MKGIEKDKTDPGVNDDHDKGEPELNIIENDLYSWLISSAYQSYNQEQIKKNYKKSINNKSKKTKNKKQKGA
jgi:hypothetical protein